MENKPILRGIEEKEELKNETEPKYIFPFQRRARSYSPEKNSSDMNDDISSCFSSQGNSNTSNQNTERGTKVFSLKFSRGSGERSCDKIRSGGGPIIAKSNFFFCDQRDFKKLQKGCKEQDYEEQLELLRIFARNKEIKDVDFQLMEEYKNQQRSVTQEDEWMF